MRHRHVTLTLAMVISSILAGLVLLGASSQQGSPPPFPVTFKGTVTVQGSPAPEGLSLVVCVVDCKDYETVAAITQAGGKYRGLVVAPPDRSYVGKDVTFWIVTTTDTGNEVGRIQADETLKFNNSELTPTQDLTFTDPVPMAPEDTPTPQPTPTTAPVNTPTPQPTATATMAPTPTATTVPPIPGDPSVPQMSRLAVFIGIGALAAGAIAVFLARRRNAL